MKAKFDREYRKQDKCGNRNFKVFRKGRFWLYDCTRYPNIAGGNRNWWTECLAKKISEILEDSEEDSIGEDKEVKKFALKA